MSDVTVADRKERSSALEAFARAVPREEPAGGIRPPAIGPAERTFGAVAVAVHRDEKAILQKLKTLAAAAGKDWYYRFPVRSKKAGTTDWIEGPSIKLANDLARIYGNCDVDVRVFDLGDSWLFYARFTDFETGYSLTRPFQQRKGAAKIGGDDDARRLDIAFQIGASKSIRNVVVNALQTFADFAFEEARNELIDKIGANLDGWRKRTLQGLEAKIDPRRAERVVGRAAGDWLATDVAKVIAMMKAVADGMATWDESFPPIEEARPAGDPAQPSKMETFAAQPIDAPEDREG